PIAGVVLSRFGGRTDPAALAVVPEGSRRLVFPVFEEERGIPLSTIVDLFNPGARPVRVVAEAFDAGGRSLERVALAALPARGTRRLSTANIGGTLPVGTASVRVRSRRAVQGAALIGAMANEGLAAARAVGPNDRIAHYDLIGSQDGTV